MTTSCLYTGTIRHRRHAEHETEFRHPLALALLDLDELPDLLHGRLVRPRPGMLRFRRRDYMGGGVAPLADEVRALVAEQLSQPPRGPIWLLTQLQALGRAFNPVSFYYCFDGERLSAVVAEVTNTPWRERHSYVLPADGERVDATFAKDHHVSPFMAMAQTYRARLTTPGSTLLVHIESEEQGQPMFDATLAMTREPLTARRATRLALRSPFPGARSLALIYGHAAGLKAHGVAVHPHPVRSRA